jgi:predicted GNAT family acetyltransferase
MPEVTVVHRPSQGKFELDGDGESLGYLDYSFSDKDTLCIDYVEVAPALRGKQMGNRLVDAAVEWARANKHSVIARCSFARAVLNRAPTKK